MLLGLTPMSSAQDSFCLGYPNVDSLTWSNKTRAGEGRHLGRTGAKPTFGHKAGWLEPDWEQAGEEQSLGKFGQKAGWLEPDWEQAGGEQSLGNCLQQHRAVTPAFPRGCWAPGGGHVRLHTGLRLGFPLGPGFVSQLSGERLSAGKSRWRNTGGQRKVV